MAAAPGMMPTFPRLLKDLGAEGLDVTGLAGGHDDLVDDPGWLRDR